MAASAPEGSQLRHYNFFLEWFKDGSSMLFNGDVIRMDCLTLYYDLYIDGVLSGRTVCGYVEFDGRSYSFESILDGYAAYGVNYFPPLSRDYKNAVKFYFTPNDFNISSEFFVSANAMIFCLQNSGLFEYSSSFFTSLNGKYGSFPDGTSVTVANKEGVFKVKSSELFWNDNDTKEYMIAYVLADSLGNFLMVPDIHVSLCKIN